MSGGEVDMDLAPYLTPRIAVPAGAADLLLTGLMSAVAYILRAVEDGWPVDTGYSLSRWRQNGTRVTNDADYAAYVHKGLYQRLIAAALPDGVKVAEDTIRRAMDRRGEGRKAFRERARAAAARRAQGGTVRPSVVAPLGPGALVGVADTLAETAAARAVRSLPRAAQATVRGYFAQGRYADIPVTLRRAGFTAEATTVQRAIDRARARAA